MLLPCVIIHYDVVELCYYDFVIDISFLMLKKKNIDCTSLSRNGWGTYI
jgi:hypothetical protein